MALGAWIPDEHVANASAPICQRCSGGVCGTATQTPPFNRKKLLRFPHTQLDGMQDLGGVRVVLPSVEDVRRIEKMLLGHPGTHVLKNHNDYMNEPKADGYRGVHIVHAYRTVPATHWETYKA